MALTKTVPDTLRSVTDRANPNELASALALVKLGTVLTPIVKDTGTIVASAAVTLDPPALVVQSARVVTSGTAGSIGSYLVADAGATAFVPTAANERPGVATISADGKTITFPNTITRAVIQYIQRPSKDLDSLYPPS